MDANSELQGLRPSAAKRARPRGESASSQHGAGDISSGKPRSWSFSQRLRSASEVDGVNAQQRSILKELLVGGDPAVTAAMDAFNNGDGALLKSE